MSDIAKLLDELGEWEIKTTSGVWLDATDCRFEGLREIAQTAPHRLRRKPKTVTLTVTMPQPLKTAENGQEVWYLGAENAGEKSPGGLSYRNEISWHVAALYQGYLYATREERNAAVSAMREARLRMMESVK